MPKFPKKNRTLICLLIILAVAAFFRLWQLDSLPPSLWPDEAINANTALEILDSGKFQVFYPENHGREGLFFLLISFAFSVLGISIWSFKLVPAIAGIFTVLGQYLLAREIFGKKTIALLSAFFLAISFWHINFSRVGFRAIVTPLILVFSFYFFFRGLRTRKVWDFLLSGLIFGAGFHTYISFRLAALLLAFALIFWFFVSLKEKWSVKFFVFTSLLLLAVFIVALPIGLYFLENPKDFMSRAMGVSVFEQINPIIESIKSFGTHLLMFNFAGDLNWRHNLSGFPQLSPAVGIFFLIGIFWSIYQIIILLKNNQPSRLKRVGSLLFIFVWFFSLLLPSVLTVEGIPHALRTIGVIPAAYLFAGLGAYLVYGWAKNKWQEKQMKVPVLKGVSFLLLFLMALFSFISYFVAWANSPQLEEAFTKRFSEVGKELNSLPTETQKYVIKNEGDLPSEVPKFIQRTAGRNEAIYIQPREVETIDFSPSDFIFIMNEGIHFLDPIRERFPGGVLYEKEKIFIYEIK
jgi:4-amino-4-deoxy-L-arabinose transferase-like glycosyltransferase